MATRMYHYIARKGGWSRTDEEFAKLRKWASTQVNFWWNYLGGNLSTFSFWAEPKVVADLFEQEGWSLHNLDIEVGKGALPQESE